MVLSDVKFLYFSIIAIHSRQIVRDTIHKYIIYTDHMETTSIDVSYWNVAHKSN